MSDCGGEGGGSRCKKSCNSNGEGVKEIWEHLIEGMKEIPPAYFPKSSPSSINNDDPISSN